MQCKSERQCMKLHVSSVGKNKTKTRTKSCDECCDTNNNLNSLKHQLLRSHATSSAVFWHLTTRFVCGKASSLGGCLRYILAIRHAQVMQCKARTKVTHSANLGENRRNAPFPPIKQSFGQLVRYVGGARLISSTKHHN